MEDLLAEIEACLLAGHFYAGLFCALAIPDICGALSAKNGRATGKRYAQWFDDNMPESYKNVFPGEQCYLFRCAALHQGRATHNQMIRPRVLFLSNSGTANIYMHLNTLNDALNLDLITFCQDISRAATSWLEKNRHDDIVQGNIACFMRRHRGGLPGYVSGVDVLS